MLDQTIKTFDTLQAGDSVVIGHKRNKPYTLETIAKVTATQIVLTNGDRYSKKTRQVFGGTSFSGPSSWMAHDVAQYWVPMSVERMNQLNGQAQDEKEKRQLISNINNNSNKLSGLSLDDLTRIAEIMGI